MSITEQQLIKIEFMRAVEGKSFRRIAKEVLGSETKESSVRRYLNHLRGREIAEQDEIIRKNMDQQKTLDNNRVARKVLRERMRVANLVETLTESLIGVFKNNTLSSLTKAHKTAENAPVGVLQLSDIHFGERIDDILDNAYDNHVVAARLRKLVDRAKKTFKSNGVKTVLLAMTGDLINSDRRLDEVTSNSDNRASILFTAVDFIQQVIRDLNEDFNVNIASVCGNESRIGKDVGWTKFTGSDSFDAIIHNTLSRLFEGAAGVNFIPMEDCLECVVNVNGSNLLLVHGHNGTANTSRAETEVYKIRAKYAARGVKLDYVIFGHIHSAYISDLFARSSGMPGGNSYSDKALNLSSKASQNIYLFWGDGSIDGMKVDLQRYDEDFAYNWNKSTESYKSMKQPPATVVIHSSLI